MRFRVFLIAAILVSGSLALPSFAHASIPFFGPIIPDAWNRCPASWGGLIIVVNNIIELLLTLAIVMVAPLTIAYGGFLYVVNPMNPDGISQAKSIITHTILGIIIALAAWMIVDAFLAILTPNGQPFGQNWKALIGTGSIDPCLNIKAALSPSPTGGVAGVTTGGVNYLAPVSGNCSPSALEAAGISPAISTQMSCIAKNESNCNLTSQNPTTSAHGLFQVVMGYNDTGHNLNFPQCTAAAQAAGFSVSGNLNCSQAFSGGKPKPDQTELVNACLAASNNANCNATAAQWLYDNNKGFSNWKQTAGNCGI